MAYNLTTGSGNIITIADGTIDTTSTTLALPGRNYSGYGQPEDQDLIRLMENFASTTVPTKPLAGQLWFDTTASPGTLKLCPADNTPAAGWLGLLTNPVNGDLTVNGNILVTKNGTINGNLTVGGTISGSLLNNVTFINTGLGAAAPSTYNAAANVLVSYNTVGAAVAGNTTNYYAAGVCNAANTTGMNPTTGSIYGSWTLAAGTALTATYADLAERHHSDMEYPLGTVMKVGGINEITAAGDDDEHDVLGVVSKSYAYLMNSGAGDDLTHPAVALAGRVPVRVIGSISKGDRIVPTGVGCARKSSTTSSFGWALESNVDAGEKLVLCVIK